MEILPEQLIVFIRSSDEKDFIKKLKSFSKCKEFFYLLRSGYREAGYKVYYGDGIFYGINTNNSDVNTKLFFVNSSLKLGIDAIFFDGNTFLSINGKVLDISKSAIIEA